MIRYARIATLHGADATPQTGPPVTSVSQPEGQQDPAGAPLIASKRPEFQLDLFDAEKSVPNVTCAGACKEKRKKTFSLSSSSSLPTRARVTLGPVDLVREAERWLQVPARLPQRIAPLLQAWRAIDAERASWEARTAALLQARRNLRIEAFDGKDGRSWWRASPPSSDVPARQYAHYIDATKESVESVFALLEQLVGENSAAIQGRVAQSECGSRSER
jgi:hypothetical protein